MTENIEKLQFRANSLAERIKELQATVPLCGHANTRLAKAENLVQLAIDQLCEAEKAMSVDDKKVA